MTVMLCFWIQIQANSTPSKLPLTCFFFIIFSAVWPPFLETLVHPSIETLVHPCMSTSTFFGKKKWHWPACSIFLTFVSNFFCINFLHYLTLLWQPTPKQQARRSAYAPADGHEGLCAWSSWFTIFRKS